MLRSNSLILLAPETIYSWNMAVASVSGLCFRIHVWIISNTLLLDYCNSRLVISAQVSLLKRYEAERRPANMAMMAVLDGIQKVYSIDLGPLNVVRATAFQGANYISPLKRGIIRYASGELGLPLLS